MGTQALCLLRLVQMGVAVGAREVNICIGVDAVEVVLENDRPATAFLRDPDRPLFILLSGCIHAGFSKILVTSGRKRYHLDDSFVFRVEQGSFRSGVSFLFLGAFDRNLKAELVGRLRACPARVIIDDESINSTEATQRCLLALELQSNETAFADSLWNEARSKSERPDLVEFLFTSESKVQFLLHDDGILTENRHSTRWQTQLQAVLNVSADSTRSSEQSTSVAQIRIGTKQSKQTALYFVKHGVIVGQILTDWPPGIEGYVSAVGLDTDLSGLSLVENGKFEARLAQVRTSLKRLLPYLTRPELGALRELLVSGLSRPNGV